jgi:hypothetical protein
MQLVSGCDASLNAKHLADWEHIRQRKQDRVFENNKRANMNHHNQQHTVGTLILLKARKHSKDDLEEHEGPCEVTQVNDNGMVHFQKGITTDAVNIRRVKPIYQDHN